jgi:hypothetical protein
MMGVKQVDCQVGKCLQIHLEIIGDSIMAKQVIGKSNNPRIMATDIEVFLKFKEQDVRYPEIRTAFLTELEPLVIGVKIVHHNYANKPKAWQLLELIDVFDYDGYTQEDGTPEVFFQHAHFMYGTPGRYVVARLHYFTPERNLERFRTVRLLITENGLEHSC